MHKEAYAQMDKLLGRWDRGPAKVLDVGSYDVNGNYRALVVDRGWNYTGTDITPGRNVDVVSPNPYSFPFDNDSFDIVMTGSTMEHVEAIWLWVPELVRVLCPDGMLAIITHTHWAYHPHPVDCWRIMPDGMRYLFDLTGRLHGYDILMYCATDISATAWKTVTK